MPTPPSTNSMTATCSNAPVVCGRCSVTKQMVRGRMPTTHPALARQLKTSLPDGRWVIRLQDLEVDGGGTSGFIASGDRRMKCSGQSRSPAPSARPTGHGARVAPLQSPILRAGSRECSTSSELQQSEPKRQTTLTSEVVPQMGAGHAALKMGLIAPMRDDTSQEQNCAPQWSPIVGGRARADRSILKHGCDEPDR